MAEAQSGRRVGAEARGSLGARRQRLHTCRRVALNSLMSTYPRSSMWSANRLSDLSSERVTSVLIAQGRMGDMQQQGGTASAYLPMRRTGSEAHASLTQHSTGHGKRRGEARGLVCKGGAGGKGGLNEEIKG